MSTVGVACPQCREVNREARSTCARCGTPLPVTLGEGDAGNGKTVVFRRGQLIANRYIVQEMIGRGGMGCIYKVRDNTLGEIVVLKTLLPQYTQDSVVVERFFNEARIARQLAHPNVVRVHDIGAAPECVYISMEYVEGKSLRQLMEEVPSGGTIPLALVIRIFCDLCDALQYAHRHTIHRDIKPENVMIGRDGAVKLMDFGISKLMANPNMTATSMVMGTPQYMSPEQLRNSAKVDARADIYSMGVMLYEVLTGTVPGEVLEPASTNARHIPKALDPIVAKCLEPQADKRYATAAELKKALESVAGKASRITPDIVRRGTGAASGHPRTARAIGLLLLLAIAAATVASLWKVEQDRRAYLPQPAAVATPLADDVFDRLAAVIEQAELRAETAPATRNGDPRAAQAAAILQDAQRLWATGQERQERAPDQAVDMARDALRKFLAVAVWPEDAAYVSRGPAQALLPNGNTVRSEVREFFIDKSLVSVGDYTASVGLGNVPGVRNAVAEPVVNLTLYEAQFYAARQSPPRQVPTALQYARASSELMIQRKSEEDEEVADNEEDAPEAPEFVDEVLTFHEGLSEWTATPAGEGAVETELSFGRPYVVMRPHMNEGGETTLNAHARVFEERSPYLGFRCVLELPDDPQRAAELLETIK